MANKIIIPAQKLLLKDLKASIKNGNFKKIYVQCALKKLSGNDATFDLIAFAGKRNVLQKWGIGKPVKFVPDPDGTDQEFDLADYDEPISFGNNEIYDFDFTKKQLDTLTISAVKRKQHSLMKAIKKTLKDKEKMKTAFLSFRAIINSPLRFDVTLERGIAASNPSPPADPF